MTAYPGTDAARPEALRPPPRCQRFRTWVRFLALVSLVLLGACASQTMAPSDAGDWDSQATQLSKLDQWRAVGKLALRSAEQSETAAFDWQQQGNWTELALSGPVGLNATRLSSDGSNLIVERDGSTSIYDISTPGAIQRSTGWDLPLNALPYWLRGLPQPDQEPIEQSVSGGHLHHLSQLGWDVTYEGYSQVDSDQYGSTILPTRIILTRAATRLRLIIRRWQLP